MTNKVTTLLANLEAALKTACPNLRGDDSAGWELAHSIRRAIERFQGNTEECKGKGAARALAVMVLDPKIKMYLTLNDPKALEQAKKALEPFGYPDLDALRSKLGL